MWAIPPKREKSFMLRVFFAFRWFRVRHCWNIDIVENVRAIIFFWRQKFIKFREGLQNRSVFGSCSPNLIWPNGNLLQIAESHLAESHYEFCRCYYRVFPEKEYRRKLLFPNSTRETHTAEELVVGQKIGIWVCHWHIWAKTSCSSVWVHSTRWKPVLFFWEHPVFRSKKPGNSLPGIQPYISSQLTAFPILIFPPRAQQRKILKVHHQMVNFKWSLSAFLIIIMSVKEKHSLNERMLMMKKALKDEDKWWTLSIFLCCALGGKLRIENTASWKEGRAV